MFSFLLLWLPSGWNLFLLKNLKSVTDYAQPAASQQIASLVKPSRLQLGPVKPFFDMFAMVPILSCPSLPEWCILAIWKCVFVSNNTFHIKWKHSSTLPQVSLCGHLYTWMPSVPGCCSSLTVRVCAVFWPRPSCQVRLLPPARRGSW